MSILLRVVALLLAGIVFLAYGWGNRDYLNAYEKLFWLSPGFGLLIIGAMPFSLLRVKETRLLASFVFLIGIAKTLNGLAIALRSPIEPDTNAAVLNALILMLLGVGLYLGWRPARKPNL